MALSSILSIAIVFLIFIIIVLAVIYLNMSIKEKNNKNIKKGEMDSKEKNEKSKTAKNYTKESVFDFMEFDKIEDNMIIQKGGKRFLMVLECQGINYDLMSEMEKTAVESGFIQFLNTLRNPIQIYIQTRTINLEDSLKNYKEKLKKIENDLISKENRYKSMIESGNYTSKQLNSQKLEIKRQSNLYAYGRDVVLNTEKISMNKNVLRKKYYLVLSYYFNDQENDEMKSSEIAEIAFSDLYTKSQSTMRTLAISGVNARVLNSYELVDLLYNAYNRDEAENYGIERAERAEYDSLYITSQDILQKKMNAIDKTIQEKALELAEDSVKYANKELSKKVNESEENLEDLIMELANQLVDENKEYLKENVTKEAKKKIAKLKITKEEENKDAKRQEKAKKSIAG